MLFSFFSFLFSFTLDLLIHAKHLFLISVLELFSLSFFVLVLFYPETSFFLFSLLVPHYDYYQTNAFACLYEFVRSLPFYFWRKSQQSKAGCFLYFLYIRKRENKAKEKKEKKKEISIKVTIVYLFPPQNGHARTLFRVLSTPHDFEIYPTIIISQASKPPLAINSIALCFCAAETVLTDSCVTASTF